MITLKDDIENLDRMVDGDTPKDKIRSQIRLIAREVAALEADYAILTETHAKFTEAHEKAITERDEIKVRDEKAMLDSMDAQNKKRAEDRRRNSPYHGH